jgi:peptidoglycan/LPS O-acetylase OafA/YrhL
MTALSQNTHHPMTLRDCLQQGRPNNLDFLRIFAAFLVLFGHSFTLLWSSPSYLFPHDPVSVKILHSLPFQEGLPGIGLHIFFFISGLLVTRSFINNQGHVHKFIKARLLRILPGYVTCILILAFFAGPILTKLTISDYLKSEELWDFVVLNLTFTGLATLPGVFEGNPFGRFVNGSLWTIPYELQLYVWVLLLGCLTLLKRRVLFSLIFLYFLLAYCGSGRSQLFMGAEVPRLWVLFFMGIFSCLYADKIIISPRFALAAVIPLALTWKPGNPWLDVMGSMLFCYYILVFSFFKYFRVIDIGRIGDYSYGIYLYAFPVQQTLIYFFKNSLSAWLLVFYTTVMTVILAVMSWYLVEKPALRLKV